MVFINPKPRGKKRIPLQAKLFSLTFFLMIVLRLRLKMKNSTVFTVEVPYGLSSSTSIHPDRVDDDNPAMRNLSRVETFYPTLQTLYNKYGAEISSFRQKMIAWCQRSMSCKFTDYEVEMLYSLSEKANLNMFSKWHQIEDLAPIGYLMPFIKTTKLQDCILMIFTTRASLSWIRTFVQDGISPWVTTRNCSMKER